MPELWEPLQIVIDGVLDRVGSIVRPLSPYIPSEGVLTVAVAASVMVVWWLTRKLVKLALFAAVLGGAAWLWYFGLPGAG